MPGNRGSVMVTAALLVTIHDLQNGWPEACQHWSKIALFGSASPHRKGSALEASDSRALLRKSLSKSGGDIEPQISAMSQ
jgi:hypothetical protein